MPRGPYKQYEHNPTIAVPKTTNYNKRKRLAEEGQTENEYDIEHAIQIGQRRFDIDDIQPQDQDSTVMVSGYDVN